METSASAEETLLDRLSQPTPDAGDVIDRVELKQRLGLESDYLAGRLLTQLGGHRDAGLGALATWAGGTGLSSAPGASVRCGRSARASATA